MIVYDRLMALKIPDVERSYTQRDPIFYALSLGFGQDPINKEQLPFVLENDLAGIYNVAGDGMLPWSEVATICGKRTVPLSPLLTGTAALPLRAIGYDMPPEVLELLRYGRGVDGTKLVDAGFRYRYTSAGTVEDFAQALRLRSTVGEGTPEYTYQADVEQFFKHSPAVVRDQPVP